MVFLFAVSGFFVYILFTASYVGILAFYNGLEPDVGQ